MAMPMPRKHAAVLLASTGARVQQIFSCCSGLVSCQASGIWEYYVTSPFIATKCSLAPCTSDMWQHLCRCV